MCITSFENWRCASDGIVLKFPLVASRVIRNRLTVRKRIKTREQRARKKKIKQQLHRPIKQFDTERSLAQLKSAQRTQWK